MMPAGVVVLIVAHFAHNDDCPRAVATLLSAEQTFAVRLSLIVVTVVLMAVSFPHALEDFQYGGLSRFGVSLGAAHVILLVAYALQFLGVVLTARGHRAGPPLLGGMGLVWCTGAVLVHGHELLFAAPGYRHGIISRLLEGAIIVLGATAAVLGLIGRKSHV